MEVNKLFNPDSETFGEYEGTWEECIYAMRLLNRVIDGAYFIEGYTPSRLPVEVTSYKGVDAILAFADYAERILNCYQEKFPESSSDRDSSYIKRTGEFVRDLREIAHVNYGDMFGYPQEHMKIRSRLANIVRNCDCLPSLEDHVFFKLADVLEEMRGTIFSDVLNWDYVLDLMETLPGK